MSDTVDVFYGSENDGPRVQSFPDEDAAKLFRQDHRDTILVNGEPAVIDADGSVVESPEEDETTPEEATEQAREEQAAPATIEDAEDDDGADGPAQPGRHVSGAPEPAANASPSQDATTANVQTDNSTSRQTAQ